MNDPMDNELESLTNGNIDVVDDESNDEISNLNESEDEKNIEKQETGSRKEFLKKRMDDYVNGFTIHGLTRGIKGPRRESFLWLLVLLLSVLLTTFVLHKLLTKYYSYETYTEIRSFVTYENKFPSLSICEWGLLRVGYFSYCGVQISEINNSTEYDKQCNHDNIYKPPENISAVVNNKWSNGVFEVMDCFTWDGKPCNNKNYFKSHNALNHSCITWNFNGDLFDTYGHVDMTIKYIKTPNMTRKPRIIAIPHDHKIVEIDLTKKVNVDPYKMYEIKLIKTEIIRKPYPYPSNCTDSLSNMLDILPGAYSRRTCLESYKMVHAYKECGDTFDYIRNFIPVEIKEKYERNNITIQEMKKCIFKAVSHEPPKDACPFPCKELDLGIVSSSHEQDSSLVTDEWIYNIAIQFQNVDSYKIFEEKPLYSADQMTCEIGGFMGLVMGASLLSFIEIIICGILLIFVKLSPEK